MARVVVVTGASSGVGRATVRLFAARGYDVALLARGNEGLDAAADEVKRAGQRATVCPVDVADADQVERAAGLVEERLGAIDIWVNNAIPPPRARPRSPRPRTRTHALFLPGACTRRRSDTTGTWHAVRSRGRSAPPVARRTERRKSQCDRGRRRAAVDVATASLSSSWFGCFGMIGRVRSRQPTIAPE
jgi:hypothetical protein